MADKEKDGTESPEPADGPRPVATAVPSTRPVPGGGPPEPKGKKARVVYSGPNDAFVVGEHRLERFGEPAEVPQSTLDWLRDTYPQHSFSEAGD